MKIPQMAALAAKEAHPQAPPIHDEHPRRHPRKKKADGYTGANPGSSKHPR